MKPRITVYLTDGQLDHLRREAARQRVSLSRYATERLAPPGQEEGGSDVPAEKLATSVRKMLAERADGLAENLRTVIVMLDQLVRLSTPDETDTTAPGNKRLRNCCAQTRTQAVAESRTATERMHDFSAANPGAPPRRAVATSTGAAAARSDRGSGDHRHHRQRGWTGSGSKPTAKVCTPPASFCRKAIARA